MSFKPDAPKIKRWREERRWSQEHLADLAGIGLRTVQRIENGEPASQESLKALAAAFNVDVVALSVDQQAEAVRLVALQNARIRSGMRVAFWIHLASYVMGMIIFAAISIGVGGDHYAMILPTIWWTVGLSGHAVAVVIVEVVTRHQDQFEVAG
ncbi:XRE family transcriptional regulator [Henriciella aquimarina]|uniref:XRE family transcriptional regulator n=1 Tax=Henriciella aquimarina TaxID=545261 RepID=UPI0009FD4EB2|nr:XRE family transcriptional regulator [Henriciella aquimarina]